MTLDWLPFRSTRAIARALRRRADTARDARQWRLAGMLYEEALALGPEDARVRVQCGHMFKEAGDYEQAERHYHVAARLLPNDADLALQLGHFHKVAGQPARAAEAYARALTLMPGWDDAQRELRLLSGVASRTEGGAGAPPLPALLPSAASPGEDDRERIVVHRLGAELAPGATGARHVLRGVQAVRGYCVSHVPLHEVVLVIDGAEARHVALAASADRPDHYIFNIWHDFSSVAVGEREIELRFTGVQRGGRPRAHRAMVQVAPPIDDPARHASDAFVPAPPAGVSLEAHVAALPSVIRPAARRLLPRLPRTVLVQRVDQLGDLCCSVPAIRRLRALLPAARIVGLVSHANADLARSLALFDELVVADFPEQDGRRAMTAAAQQALADELARFPFDLAIDLSQSDESRPLLLLSQAPFLCGFGIRQFPWLDAGLEFSAPDPLDRLDAIAHGRKASLLVEALALAMADGAPIVPRPKGVADAERRLRYGVRPGRRYAVLHGGARLPFSRWPGFAELATLLLTRTDLDILLIDVEGDLPRSVADDARLHRLAGLLPFDEFDALVAGAAIFVGNDSGPKHLASLRGTKVVSLHMARLNWNEWGQEQTGLIVSRRVPCAGCGIARHPEECGRDFACLRQISPNEVLAAVLSQLGE